MPSFKSKIINDKRTICEVHREIYDLVCDHMPDSKDKETIENKLEEAFNMAKKMEKKLRQYKFNYDDGWWEIESEKIRNEKFELRRSRKDAKAKKT